ncbi:MAG: hypothetical protein R3F07_04165 [Opitutaceae bacterium]
MNITETIPDQHAAGIEAVRSDALRFDLWAVVFVLSAGMFGYEILLTRIASVLLTTDHLFLVLAFALLGLALGAIVDYHIAVRRGQVVKSPPGLWLTWNGAVIVVSIIALVRLGPSGGAAVLAVSAALPFASAGMIFSRLFRLYPGLTGSLYGADLLGAAAGALLVPASLSAMGPVQTIILYAVVQAGVGTVLIIPTRRGRLGLMAAAVAVLAGGVFVFNWHDGLVGPIPVGRSVNKDLYRLSASAVGEVETVDSRWSNFGRTDLVRFAREPDSMSIFIDGAAGTPMFRFDGDLSARSVALRNVNRASAGALPLALLESDQKDNALIIGPGGGRDVLLALQAGFKRITAVDVNPQMIEIVKANEAFNGGLYTKFDNVDIIVDEGRRYLRASKDRYDLITLFMPITKSSRGLNAFALSENYLFTKEAFRDYHDHLTSEGIVLIMAHSMEEAVKLTTTAVEALQAEGLSVGEAMDHVYLLGSHTMPYFVLTKRPLDAARSAQIHALAHAPTFDSRYSYVPGVEQDWSPLPVSASATGEVSMMNPLLYDLAEGNLPLGTVERGLGLNLVPATDDRPFFSQFGFGPPGLVLTVLWVSLVTLVAAVIIPEKRLCRRLVKSARGSGVWLPVWFAGIGVGFIVFELVLLQKLAFHLGDPSRSLILLLASLLIGSGVGSLFTVRMGERGAVFAGILSGAGAIAIAFLLPVVFQVLQTASPAVKLAVAGALLVVQGVPMGMMFPIGLRVADRTFGPVAVPWMWAINGAASVVGSALTVVLAMTAGYNWSLTLGVVCYVLAAFAAYRSTRSSSRSGGELKENQLAGRFT